MNIKDLNKIELWGANLLYAFAILTLISHGSNAHTEMHLPEEFHESKIKFDYLSNYFFPELFRYSIIYISFLLLNFCCLPPLYKKMNVGFNISIIAFVYLISGLVISITGTYSKAFVLVEYETIDEGYNQLFFEGFAFSAWLVSLISIYVILKKLVIQLIENKDKDSNNPMKLEIAFGGAFWFVGMLVWLFAGVSFDIILCWTLVVSAGIFSVIYSIHYLIPLASAQPKPLRFYNGKIALIAPLTNIPLFIIAAIVSMNRDIFGPLMVLNVGAQLVICGPLAWYIYKKRNETEEQITTLKKELGKSDANLGFLKSQINPHFLFNALNTLYGTALQENAERTGEGIQKLGDMMRFMLEENMLDKISLSRDIDYLNNYIALQKLRTSIAVDITINTEIEEPFTALQISPMLLIPFVENAFKHGISLQSPSHIKVTLQTKGNTLYFDVNNSIHLKADGDPEKYQSGIGLPNVKQRLNLLYPKKHELIIRESAKEFFVHLTLTLD